MRWQTARPLQPAHRQIIALWLESQDERTSQCALDDFEVGDVAQEVSVPRRVRVPWLLLSRCRAIRGRRWHWPCRTLDGDHLRPGWCRGGCRPVGVGSVGLAHFVLMREREREREEEDLKSWQVRQQIYEPVANGDSIAKGWLAAIFRSASGDRTRRHRHKSADVIHASHAGQLDHQHHLDAGPVA